MYIYSNVRVNFGTAEKPYLSLTLGAGCDECEQKKREKY